jgi:hypothetical protein
MGRGHCVLEFSSRLRFSLVVEGFDWQLMGHLMPWVFPALPARFSKSDHSLHHDWGCSLMPHASQNGRT